MSLSLVSREQCATITGFSIQGWVLHMPGRCPSAELFNNCLSLWFAIFYGQFGLERKIFLLQPPTCWTISTGHHVSFAYTFLSSKPWFTFLVLQFWLGILLRYWTEAAFFISPHCKGNALIISYGVRVRVFLSISSSPPQIHTDTGCGQAWGLNLGPWTCSFLIPNVLFEALTTTLIFLCTCNSNHVQHKV